MTRALHLRALRLANRVIQWATRIWEDGPLWMAPVYIVMPIVTGCALGFALAALWSWRMR